MMWFWGNGFWGMGAMVLAWVLFFALCIWLIYRITQTESRPATPEPAERVLDRRFAAGELTLEQYTEMRRELRSTSAGK